MAGLWWAARYRVTAVAEPGHGAPITGLSHVQLLVSDTGASARWYCTVLGLDLLAEDPDSGYVALRHREAKLVIVLTAGLAPGKMSQDSAEEALDHLAFAVPDADSLRRWRTATPRFSFAIPMASPSNSWRPRRPPCSALTAHLTGGFTDQSRRQ
jgi:catechol 2,3-dioxygenase-like lactoylglutathione lyase family enzyme